MAVTVVTPINIAFIKYWGKTDEDLIIPTNDSFSITLSTDQFRTKTSVVAGEFDGKDRLWLNGEEEDLSKAGRLANVLNAVRATLPEEQRKLAVRIVSENNFPTAAGMASSAAGLSALAFALAKLFNSPIDVSILARIGSGSACRSVLGGFVKWNKGTQKDGTDCKASQHVDEAYWPEMQVMCLVTKAEKKEISSTKGMRYAVENSPLMEGRINERVPERMAAISEAITKRDFATFGDITMVDCEDFRDVCKSSTPCVNYWTDKTEQIIALVKAFNAHAGKTVVAYTYDAGANAFIFCEKPTLAKLLAYFLHYFPTKAESLFLEDAALHAEAQKVVLEDELKNVIPAYDEGHLTFILHSPVGSGPGVRPDGESLVTEEGLPKAA
eukprot:TRINITY_DN20807_c0_g1_i1.p2 TRINITY_DN20807_c0_g1~~TRINITY_DN20807_c0_g1_i1.p2  ORF type:complete len:384 (+),score=201.82 TRINITY_DN20807_c0_g1_i1:70-1221(+)